MCRGNVSWFEWKSFSFSMKNIRYSTSSVERKEIYLAIRISRKHIFLIAECYHIKTYAIKFVNLIILQVKFPLLIQILYSCGFSSFCYSLKMSYIYVIVKICQNIIIKYLTYDLSSAMFSVKNDVSGWTERFHLFSRLANLILQSISPVL